jgi:hypothetical protein
MFNVPQSAYASTTPPAKVATGTTRKTMWQIQADPLGSGIQVVEWFIYLDASALATPVLVELLDTGNQGASGSNWTPAKMPISTLATAITATGTTSLVLATGGGANFPSGSPFTAYAFPNIGVGGGTGAEGPLTGTRELVAVSSRSTDTLTVVRNADGAGALSSIPIGSPVVGVNGQFEADITCDNAGINGFPWSSVVYQNCGFNNGTGANGTDFGSVTRTRILGMALIEPIGGIGPVQLPLGRETEVGPGDYCRIAITSTGGSVNAILGAKWTEG